MKKKFNILATIILLSIAASIVSYFIGPDFQYFIHEFKRGSKRGYQEIELNQPTVYLNLDQIDDNPKTFQLTNTLNSKELDCTPLYIKTTVDLENINNDTYKILGVVNGLLSFIILIAFFVAFYAYLKFIIATNRNQLFERSNRRQLKVLGWALLILFVSKSIFINLIKYGESTIVHFENFKIDNSISIDYYLLILGLTSLLICQFIEIGIKMKEDQELTI